MPSQFDNKKIIPQIFDDGTPEKEFADAVIRTLPDKTGNAGKILKVSADETGAEWVEGGEGGSSSFAELTGRPEDNTALKESLDGKINKPADSPAINIGVENDGALYYEVD